MGELGKQATGPSASEGRLSLYGTGLCIREQYTSSLRK